MIIGVDMIAFFIEQRFPAPISLWTRMGLDFNPHILGQEYHTSLEQTMAKLAPVN
jgi:hypothetical protein